MEEPLKALKLAPRGMGPPELKALAESKTPSGAHCSSFWMSHCFMFGITRYI